MATTSCEGRYPDLPDPADVPRFQEEGCLDPFGQHPGVLGQRGAPGEGGG